MYSSRMRTVRSSSSLPGGGGGLPGLPGWCLPQCMHGYVWPGGVSAPVHAGICLLGGGGVSAPVHPSPVNRMTDRCKNITLPQLLGGR